MPEKALLSAIEIYRLKEIGGISAVTNMYNRLAICAAEDIGPANLPLVLTVINLVESKDIDIYKLMAITHLMCDSLKTRIMSHYWFAYTNPIGKKFAGEKGIIINDEITSDYENIDLVDVFFESDPLNIRPYILMFYKCIHEKNLNAFVWSTKYYEITKDIKIKKRKKFILRRSRSITGNPCILLWKVLSQFMAPEIHDILCDAYFNHNENIPFLQLAIIVAIHKLPYSMLNITPTIEIWSKNDTLQQMLNGKFELQVDDFVIDKHTKKGKYKGIKEFVLNGSIVSPQHPDYINSTYKEIYEAMYV